MTMENVKTMLLNERTRIKCKHRGRLKIELSVEEEEEEEVLLIDDDDELDSISQRCNSDS